MSRRPLPRRRLRESGPKAAESERPKDPWKSQATAEDDAERLRAQWEARGEISVLGSRKLLLGIHLRACLAVGDVIVYPRRTMPACRILCADGAFAAGSRES